jgi:hypothetical protein
MSRPVSRAPPLYKQLAQEAQTLKQQAERRKGADAAGRFEAAAGKLEASLTELARAGGTAAHAEAVELRSELVSWLSACGLSYPCAWQAAMAVCTQPAVLAAMLAAVAACCDPPVSSPCAAAALNTCSSMQAECRQSQAEALLAHAAALPDAQLEGGAAERQVAPLSSTAHDPQPPQAPRSYGSYPSLRRHRVVPPGRHLAQRDALRKP